MSEQKANPPVAKFREPGQGITVNIWKRETEKGGAFYDVTHEASYKDKDGNWKSTSKVQSGQIQTLRKLLDLAHTEILRLQAE